MLIAQSKGWKLFERMDSGSSEWHSMRLVLQGKRFMGGKLKSAFFVRLEWRALIAEHRHAIAREA
jgi:hypothetical protein